MICYLSPAKLKKIMSKKYSSKSTLVKRYAGALLSLASEKKKQERIAEDLNDIKKMIDSSKDLVKVIGSRIISTDSQRKALKAISEKAKFDAITARFVDIVAANGRAGLLPGIIKAYGELLSVANGEVRAVITTAIPIAKNEKDIILKSLKKLSDKKIVVEEKEGA